MKYYLSKKFSSRHSKRASSTLFLLFAGLLLLPWSVQGKDIPGATQTSYAVSPSGAFSFQVPIIVPQGVNGVQPNLSLNFSSARGNGRVGVGWDVTGLSAINRCGQTLATHGRRIGVKYEGTDRYCLDGQPLILVSGSYGVAGSEYRTEIDSFARITVTGSSANNLDGTHAATEFKVERKDGSIWTYGAGSSAIKLPGTNTIHCWKVSSVSDRNNNSYNVDYRSSDGQPASISYGGVASIDLNYENRNDVRERYFGGHKFTYNQRVASIDVKRGTSIVRQYNLGYRYSNGSQSQLTSITECGMNNECMPPIQVAWHDDAKGYSNAPASFNPREAMIEYTSNGGQTNRGVFADVNNDGYVDQVISYRNTAGSHVRRTYLGSKNGLSATPSAAWNMPIELVEYTTGIVAHSQINSTSVAKAQLVDVNSDGLPDVVFGFEHPLYIASTNTRTFKKERGVYLNNGNGWNSTLSTTFIPPEYFNSYVDNLEIKTSSSGSTFSSYILTPRGRFIDINNDGRVDWITSYFRWTGSNGGAGGVSHKAVYLNNGSAWVHNAAYSSTLPDVLTRYVREHSLPTGQMVDINGDGLVDWVQSYHHNRDGGTTNRGVWLNTGTQFEAAGNRHQALPTIAYENYGNTHNPRQHGTFIDLNGDGLTDYLADSASGSWVPGYPQGRIAYLNTGRGWVRASSYDPVGKFQHKTNRAGGLVLAHGQYMDLNNDGLVDFSEAYKDANNVNHQNSWINTGTGWVKDNSFNTGSVYFDHRGNNDNSSTSDNIKLVNGSFVDMNADGSPDWVQARAGLALLTRTSNVGRASLLSNVTTTLGVRIAPKFAPLTRGEELYIQYPELANGSIAPTEPNSFYINGASYVTESVTTPTPVSGTDSVVSYRYEGAQANRIRGFLGFKSFSATSSLTNLSTITALDQTFPYIGRRLVTATMQGDAVLSMSSNEYDNTQQTHADGTKTYFVFAKTGESQQYELPENGYALVRRTEIDTITPQNYDAYGNLLTQTSRVFDGAGAELHRTTVSNVYGAIENDWLIARLTRSTQENQSGSQAASNNATVSNTTSYTYKSDKPWLLATVNREPDSSDDAIKLTTSYGYDNYGNVELSTDTTPSNPAARISAISYDPNNRLPRTLANSLSQQSIIEYHPQCDQPDKITDANGLETTYTYDAFCRQLTETAPDQVTTSVSYSAGSQSCAACETSAEFSVTSTVPAEPDVTQYFNAFNQPIAATTLGVDDRVIQQQTVYDALGRVKEASQPYFHGEANYWTENTYDILGRLIRTHLPYFDDSGQFEEISYGYSVVNHLAQRTRTDQLDRVTTSQANALGQVVAVIDSNQQVMSYAYDSQGNLVKTTDALSNSIELAYDLLGRRIQLDDPDLGTSTYQFDGFSDLTSQTDAKNNTISMVYDALGRLTQRTMPGTAQESGGVSTWEYDTATRGASDQWVGAISQVTGPNGYQRNFSYDAIGRAEAETTTIKGTTFNERYMYDPITGDLSERYYPSSGVDGNGDAIDFGVKYGYKNGYLVSIMSTENSSGQCIEHWRANHYDALGRVTDETVGKLIATKRNFKGGQNVLEKIRSVTLRGTQQLVQDLSYNYDAVNNLSSRTDNLDGTLETFSYDELDRLISYNKGTETTSVNYDAIGNITYKSDVGSYVYAQNVFAQNSHRLTNVTRTASQLVLDKFAVDWEFDGETFTSTLPSADNLALSYDEIGNVVESGTRKLSWTMFDKPERVVSSYNDEGHATGSIYEYGPEQQRVYKKEAKFNTTSQVVEHGDETIYVGKYYEHITRVDALGNSIGVTHRYLIETGGTTIQVERDDNTEIDNTKYLLADNLGSTNLIVNTNGEVEQRLAFDPWGMRLNAGDTTRVNSVTNRGYTGHEMDDETGLINMNARVYDPYLGRFMSADPVLPDAFDMQSFNRYAYVTNNPLKYTDPTGNIKRCLGCAGAPSGGIGSDPDPSRRGSQNPTNNAEPTDNANGSGVNADASGRTAFERNAIGNCAASPTCGTAYLARAIPVPLGSGNIRVTGSALAGNGGDVFSTSFGVGSRTDTGAVEGNDTIAQNSDEASPESSIEVMVDTGIVRSAYEGVQAVTSIVDPSVGVAEIGAVRVITQRVINSGVNGPSDIRANRWTPFPVANALSSSKVLKGLQQAGRFFFVFGSAASIVNGTEAFSRGDGIGLSRSIMDFGFGVAGFLGGSVGAVGAISYGTTSAVISYIPGARDFVVTPVVDVATGIAVGICNIQGC